MFLIGFQRVPMAGSLLEVTADRDTTEARVPARCETSLLVEQPVGPLSCAMACNVTTILRTYGASMLVVQTSRIDGFSEDFIVYSL